MTEATNSSSLADLVVTDEPGQLSEAVRRGDDPLLRRRRQIVGCSLTAAGAMGLIALYQFGILRHIPEPPVPGLDADEVDASDEAYETLSVGDAFIGFASYGVTMLLAAIGGPKRHVETPLLPLALTAKVAFDAYQAGVLTVDQWVRHRAFCSWCLLASAATFAAVPAVVPETRAAWRALRSSGDQAPS